MIEDFVMARAAAANKEPETPEVENPETEVGLNPEELVPMNHPDPLIGIIQVKASLVNTFLASGYKKA